MTRLELSRRTVLKGVGVTLSLPLLDAMRANTAAAATTTGATGAAAGVAPKRMCMAFMPNGVSYKDWTPLGIGKNWDPSPTLRPLMDVKNDVSILSGLALDNAKAKGDGPGDHARSAAAFLTGADPYKTRGSDIKLGISMDQVAAQAIGNQTRLPSLEVGFDRVRQAGDCDSGYACAYVDNIAWRSATTPVPKEVDPASLFERLFGSADDAEAESQKAKRLLYRKSILDFVADDANRLNRQLGKSDQRKMDEFATSVREIEKRIDVARTQPAYDVPKPDMARPDGIPAEIEDHMKLMWDLIALAFQMDLTRVSTMMIARDGSNRSYRNLGLSEGHHSLSHHGRIAEKMEQIQKIDEFHVAQWVYFVKKLKSITEGDGTLLDNCVVMLGSGISDGNRHNHEDLPILLAGKGGGMVTPGRHLKYERNTPLCNLYLSILQNSGVDNARFGDSTGTLTQLV